MTGAFVGLLFAVGVLIIAGRILAARPARMVDRLSVYLPHMRQVSNTNTGPISTLLAIVTPSMKSFSTPFTSNQALSLRLLRAGRNPSVQQYRLTQLVWIGAGLALATVFVLLSARNSLLAIGLIVMGGVIGAIACDWLLSDSIKRRKRRILVQLPMVADLFAFSVAAGESAISALERLSRTMSGDLPNEFAHCVADVHDGMAFPAALRAVQHRCDVPQLTRFVEGVILALERGTPIAEVVRAQAMDARAQEQRRLMEIAGRKDVVMLIPIVFLILPTVVLIAIYPGIYSLDLIVS